MIRMYNQHVDNAAPIPVGPSDAMGAFRKQDGGWGVFATRTLGAGEIVISGWHETFYHGLTGWRAFTLTEVEALPEESRELVLRYGLDADFNLIVGPLDEGAVTSVDNFINHSCEPTLGYDVSGNVITARRIEIGQELTIDYGCFAVNIDEPWECQCGSAKCRKRIRRNDWIQLAADRHFAMPRFLHTRIAERLGVRPPASAGLPVLASFHIPQKSFATSPTSSQGRLSHDEGLNAC